MDYIVFQKDEFGDNWRRVDCGDEAAVQRTVLAMIKQPGDVEVTIPLMYEVKLSLGKVPADIVPKPIAHTPPWVGGKKKEAKVEATQGGPEKDTDPGS